LEAKATPKLEGEVIEVEDMEEGQVEGKEWEGAAEVPVSVVAWMGSLEACVEGGGWREEVDEARLGL